MVIMKKLFLGTVVFIISSVSVCAQTYSVFLAGTEEQRKSALFGKDAIPREDGQIVFKEVYVMDGISEADVYKRAVNSLGKLFPKYMVSITSQDEAAHVLRGKGKFEFVYSRGKMMKFNYPRKVTFDICIECREGRYRVIMDNFYLVDMESGFTSDASNYQYGDQTCLDKNGYVENSNSGCMRIGIIASYLYIPEYFREYMSEPVRKKVNDDW